MGNEVSSPTDKTACEGRSVTHHVCSFNTLLYASPCCVQCPAPAQGLMIESQILDKGDKKNSFSHRFRIKTI